MKEEVTRSGGKPSRGLRTGKIHATKATASDIRRAIGVRPSDMKVATHALMVAAGSAKTGRFVSAAKGKADRSKSGTKAKKQ